MLINGKCHCGNIAFELEWEGASPEIPARACGCSFLVTSEIANHLYAVVNVNVFENVGPSRLRRAPASFEGEDIESRLARRKRYWIADVRFADGGA